MRVVLIYLTTVFWGIAGWASPQEDLADALRLPDLLQIVRQEGLQQGDELAQGMFATGYNARWDQLVSEIYYAERLEDVVRRAFVQSLHGQDVDPLLAFFATPVGQRVLTLELDARRAMVAQDIEQAARDRFQTLITEDDPRAQQVTRFIEVNDLLELNVSGALNSLLQFYRGMADGGALELSEEDILRDVWAQEAETRIDSREWLYGYMLLAYKPLTDSELDSYIDMTATDAGQALNKALFAGFNQMYDEVSYALGLAMAEQLQGSDL
jgi:hypothetical protein